MEEDVFERARRDLADPEYCERVERAAGGLSTVDLVKKVRQELEEKRLKRERRLKRA
jgi:hypothetical protein